MMCKLWRALLCACAFLLLCIGASLGVGASEPTGGVLAEAQNELESLAGEVAEENGSSLAESVARWGMDDALASELGAEQVLTEVFGITLDAMPNALRLLCSTTGLLMISAVTRRFCEGGGALSDGVEFCSASAVLAAFIALQTDSLYSARELLERLCDLLRGMIPITGAVWAMGGNVSTATVGTAAFYGLLSATGELCAATVTPVCCIMALSAVCSALSGGGLLSGFTGAVRKVYNFLVASLMTVLVFVLGIQTSLASAADSAAARGAKLVSSTVIPVVGGAVGDTLRTVAGSVQYIKSVVGVGGIVLILALVLPTFISLLLTRLSLLLGGGIADMLGCPREARLIGELGNIYGTLIGAVAICSVAFIIALGLFVKCSVAAA